MRKVLVVSPHYPPNDTPDMHRVRMTAGHYAANGWSPTILAARAEDSGRQIDENLLAASPRDVPVQHVVCPSRTMSRLLGLNAMGLRAFGEFEQAGAKLLEDSGYELVFISTTAFPLMRLGAVWKARFGTPFVLDFQDPWATYPAGTRFRQGPRHALMRHLHQRLERMTVPELSGLMAVSPAYIELLQGAYPQIADRPSVVSPFGYSAADFEVADARGRIVPAVAGALDGGATVCLFAGRVAPSMEGQLKALFQLVAEARKSSPELFADFRLVFLGTGYVDGASEQLATRIAARAGISDMVVEAPDRAPFLDAQKSACAVQVQMVLGSEDAAFSPSKLYGSLARGKPVICVAPLGNRLLETTADLKTVIGIASDAPMTAEAFSARLKDVLAAKPAKFKAQADLAAPFEAQACAQRDCALFDRVLANQTAN